MERRDAKEERVIEFVAIVAVVLVLTWFFFKMIFF
jgi:hypothetical protein